jgi:hypothetical protein
MVRPKTDDYVFLTEAEEISGLHWQTLNRWARKGMLRKKLFPRLRKRPQPAFLRSDLEALRHAHPDDRRGSAAVPRGLTRVQHQLTPVERETIRVVVHQKHECDRLIGALLEHFRKEAGLPSSVSGWELAERDARTFIVGYVPQRADGRLEEPLRSDPAGNSGERLKQARRTRLPQRSE